MCSLLLTFTSYLHMLPWRQESMGDVHSHWQTRAEAGDLRRLQKNSDVLFGVADMLRRWLPPLWCLSAEKLSDGSSDRCGLTMSPCPASGFLLLVSKNVVRSLSIFVICQMGKIHFTDTCLTFFPVQVQPPVRGHCGRELFCTLVQLASVGLWYWHRKHWPLL